MRSCPGAYRATRTASQEALSTRLDKLFSQLNNLKEDEIEDDLKDVRRRSC
eukprot:m.464247 g.464247  ORF g.464247 m.464247 type:complete len:51 (-) comp21616_c3_seq15:616-768(-)